MDGRTAQSRGSSPWSLFPPFLISSYQLSAFFPLSSRATPIRLGPVNVARATHSIQLFPSWLPAFLIRFFPSFRVPHSEFRNYENLSSVHGSAVLLYPRTSQKPG